MGSIVIYVFLPSTSETCSGYNQSMQINALARNRDGWETDIDASWHCLINTLFVFVLC